MRLPKRDLIATALVLGAGVLYLLWAYAPLPGLSSVRATGIIVLGLGFAASASAVVSGFEALIHRNRLYLGITSLIGVLAFAAGVWMLLHASELALGILMAAMVLLWLIATIHHLLIAEAADGGRPIARSAPRGPSPAGVA